MLMTRVIPCLLVDNGRLVKTIGFKNPSYVGDPVNAIKIYNEKEVDELILLDIYATVRDSEPSFDLLSIVADECFMPLAYGGGIRKLNDIRRIFSLGIEKVVINSYAAKDPGFISEAADMFGCQSIVVSIDVKQTLFGRYSVQTHNGEKAAGFDPVEYAVMMERMGAGEIFLNSINRDGTWKGYDIALIRRVTDAVNIPVVACGGAGDIQDFGSAVKQGGASAVAAGSMVVYSGKGLGVLINFPKQIELRKIFGETTE
jgi:imidazole glycerol-phosphate synthase subunit HisF